MTADMHFDDVQKAQQEFQAAGGSWTDPSGPLSQWSALNDLVKLAERFKKGDQYALMLAIRRCANTDLVMPEWVSRGYISAFDGVHNFRTKSWDEAFGNPNPKGTNLAAARKRRLNSVAVWNKVTSARQAGKKITDDLFREIGEELGLGLTLTKEFYSAEKRRFEAWLPSADDPQEAKPAKSAKKTPTPRKRKK